MAAVITELSGRRWLATIRTESGTLRSRCRWRSLIGLRSLIDLLFFSSLLNGILGNLDSLTG
jgi:hypothetical protein